ncbi:hypothetical protein J1N35_007973 [Gossypium stocksii]|uniref:Uncharacterized protein n=1 Tax=Gossypium stocksii TaxID=47602 RepID=A0A9D3WA60_9ROSI|nr:hypothetical protein J1N35_007973 [Gossypium stocksii]
MKFTLIKLTIMKGVRDHINKMRDLAARLRALEEEARLILDMGESALTVPQEKKAV